MVLMSWLDFSPPCRTYKIPISWQKTSKTQHFMNYWCFGPWKPVFVHFIRPEYFNKIKKNHGTSLEKRGTFFEKSETQEFRNSGNLKCPLFDFWKFWIPDFEFMKFRIPDFLIIKNDEFLKSMKNRRRWISWD